MSLADELLAACEDESLVDELRALLRRAAERISEAELDAEYLELIREMNEASQQPFGANEVVKDWLIGRGRLPIEDFDEDSETKGRHRAAARMRRRVAICLALGVIFASGRRHRRLSTGQFLCSRMVSSQRVSPGTLATAQAPITRMPAAETAANAALGTSRADTHPSASQKM